MAWFTTLEHVVVYRMEFDKTRWSCSCNSDQNCIQNSAKVIFCLSKTGHCALVSFNFTGEICLHFWLSLTCLGFKVKLWWVIKSVFTIWLKILWLLSWSNFSPSPYQAVITVYSFDFGTSLLLTSTAERSMASTSFDPLCRLVFNSGVSGGWWFISCRVD